MDNFKVIIVSILFILCRATESEVTQLRPINSIMAQPRPHSSIRTQTRFKRSVGGHLSLTESRDHVNLGGSSTMVCKLILDPTDGSDTDDHYRGNTILYRSRIKSAIWEEVKKKGDWQRKSSFSRIKTYSFSITMTNSGIWHFQANFTSAFFNMSSNTRTVRVDGPAEGVNIQTLNNKTSVVLGDTLSVLCIVRGGSPQPQVVLVKNTWEQHGNSVQISTSPSGDQVHRFDIKLSMADMGAKFSCKASGSHIARIYNIQSLPMKITVTLLPIHDVTTQKNDVTTKNNDVTTQNSDVTTTANEISTKTAKMTTEILITTTTITVPITTSSDVITTGVSTVTTDTVVTTTETEDVIMVTTPYADESKTEVNQPSTAASGISNQSDMIIIISIASVAIVILIIIIVLVVMVTKRCKHRDVTAPSVSYDAAFDNISYETNGRKDSGAREPNFQPYKTPSGQDIIRQPQNQTKTFRKEPKQEPMEDDSQIYTDINPLLIPNVYANNQPPDILKPVKENQQVLKINNVPVIRSNIYVNTPPSLRKQLVPLPALPTASPYEFDADIYYNDI